MSENLIIYAGSKFGKQKKRIVEREAKRQKFPSTAEFVWTAIRTLLGHDARIALAKIENLEDGNPRA
jgi:hypothetical protein